MAQAYATQKSRDRVSLRALALAATLAQGCALPPPDVRHQADLGAISVVAGTKQPELSFRGFPASKAEGAALGAAGFMFLTCGLAPPPGCSSGAMCGAVLVVWAGVCGAAMVTGAVAGAAASQSAQTVRESEAAMAGALQANTIQAALREQVFAAFSARGSRPVEPARADTLAEVTLSRARLNPEGNPYIPSADLQLHMQATVRLVRRSDGAELSVTEYVHNGPKHTLVAWSENDGARLLAALKAGYEALGAHIHDSVFLLYPFPDREWQAGSIFVAAYGLAPIEPALIGRFLSISQVAGLQPTLRWEAFPRAPDLAAAPQDMARVRNVRYDLVIARNQNLAPAETVYRREALSRPEHTLEAPLAAGTQYYWTVRARFELDGRERVTSWGYTDHEQRERRTVPSNFSYRFRTPDSLQCASPSRVATSRAALCDIGNRAASCEW